MEEYMSAIALLPATIRAAAQTLPQRLRGRAEEIRMRVGQPLTVLAENEEHILPADRPFRIQPLDLEQMVEAATRGSVHTALENIRSGFLTVRGGHRIGLCGTAVVKEGEICNLRHLSSLCLRIARQIPGAADDILPRLLDNGRLPNTMIVSPPGLGKTTLLRDMVRQLSDGRDGRSPVRVGLVDERSEIAACYMGQPQLDVGAHTDVLDGCAKAKGMMWLLRGLSPDVLAVDEVTTPEDVASMIQASHCGVRLLCTLHAEVEDDLLRRPLYKSLLPMFQKCVMIEGDRRARVLRILDLSNR